MSLKHTRSDGDYPSVRVVLTETGLFLIFVLFCFSQYYTHRGSLDLVGKADEVEIINRTALRIAREIAERTGTLFAGGVSSTCTFTGPLDIDKPEVKKEIRSNLEEQVRWSKEEGVDYMIAETYSFFSEAEIALEVIKSFDLPAVVTFNAFDRNSEGNLVTIDNVPIADACKRLLDSGATLVGVNCMRGPETIIEVSGCGLTSH